MAQRQKRVFALRSFESTIRDQQLVKPGDGLPAQALFTGCGGGTEIGTAMRRALDLVTENPGSLKKADIVLVTDGVADTGSAT